MSDDKNKVTDKVTDKASEIAKNIWLAGVGAYGRAVDEAQGRLEKAGVESPKLFRELVKAGAALEEEARDAIDAGHTARQNVEDRINRVRENFNLQRPVRGEDLLALHQKIDRLSEQVDALTLAISASASSKAARKSSAGKKKPATRRTPAKRAAASKATAKKAAAKAAPGKSRAKKPPSRAAQTGKKAATGRSKE